MIKLKKRAKKTNTIEAYAFCLCPVSLCGCQCLCQGNPALFSTERSTDDSRRQGNINAERLR
jgi:putative bacteriocin precursor